MTSFANTTINTNYKLKTPVKHIKYSPKTFLKNYIYDDPPKGKKRRKKVTMDEFEIPSFKEFDIIVTKNFNVQQFKKYM